MVYRYHAGARVAIDAGKLVADTGKTGDYRYCTWNIVRCLREEGMKQASENAAGLPLA
jgi:hypothetical protein